MHKAYLCTLLVAAAAAAAWYVVRNDRQVRQQNRTRAGERRALELLQHIKRDQEAVRKELNNVESIRDTKKRAYTLAQCNELLLRLLERLDAIRPREAILQDDDDTATAFDEERMQHIKKRKRQIIQSIQKDFDRLDQCKQVLP